MSISTWGEYRVVCADGKQRHQVQRPSQRLSAIEAASGFDHAHCAPHDIQQRIVTKSEGDWGLLMRSDPQTDLKDEYIKVCLEVLCPKCEAEVGVGCIDLRGGSFRGRTTNWPHTERADTALTQTWTS